VTRPGVDRAKSYLQTVIIQEFGELATPGLIDQDVNGMALDGQSRAHQKKIAQVRAQDNHTITFGNGRLQVLAPIEWNRSAALVIGRFDSDNHFNAGAKKITQRPARNRARVDGSSAAGNSHA